MIVILKQSKVSNTLSVIAILNSREFSMNTVRERVI